MNVEKKVSDDDLFLFSQGNNYQAWRFLGAHVQTNGVVFRVWAPNADQVSVVGDFNGWDGRINRMNSLGNSGVWEALVAGIGEGAIYKFEIRNRNTGILMLKADPYARSSELRPSTASRVVGNSKFNWSDDAWITIRAGNNWLKAPMNVYEVHLGSWIRHYPNQSGNRGFYNYREFADSLIPYVVEMGYTHVELMPIMEHPLDESWGYQCTGYFAPTRRFGDADDFRYLVNEFHKVGVGVILDWVPGHFPQDNWALAQFDGTALYEHADPKLGYHPDWGTYVFNFGRHEVKSFLASSAHWWLSEFHIDGLRVDAVASMLYLDYSRKPGEWIPNKFGGRENLEAIEFIREVNMMVHRDFPGAVTIAEESTAWPGVSRPVYLGGLGFSMKWNMGWMNDTLSYISHDPIYRKYYQERLTFGQLYAYSENFILPFSHDEVVHGKGSLWGKMPGDDWQKFANLRLLLTYQMTTPGKKLSFMGNEMAQTKEWSCGEELPWELLQRNDHRGIRVMLADLNRLYKTIPALYELDFDAQGFSWIDCQDADNSTISFLRYPSYHNNPEHDKFVVVVLNFTPVPRYGYRLGVPQAGKYREVFNSDSNYYDGSNLGNGGEIYSENQRWMCKEHSIILTLPPLAGVILIPD